MKKEQLTQSLCFLVASMLSEMHCPWEILLHVHRILPLKANQTS